MYDKLLANPSESKELRQLNDNIEKRYQKLAPNDE
jgi:hypothetical protein